MSRAECRFSGFLEGYQQRNLEINAVAVNVLWRQICHIVENISTSDVTKKNLQSRLQSVCQRVEWAEIIDCLIIFGLDSQLYFRYAFSEKPELREDKEFRKIAYLYLSLAEIVGDSRVVKIAVGLGELF